MRRFRTVALASLLALGTAQACDLNPQPLPPIDNRGTDEPSETFNPTPTADGGTSSGSKDASPPRSDAGNESPDAGPGDVDGGDADASDADVDASDGSVSDDDDAG